MANAAATAGHPVSYRMSKLSSRLRLQTMLRLRWLAVAGQTSALLLTYFGLGFDLPLVATAVVIAMSVIVNVVLVLRFPTRYRLSVIDGTALLVYDVLQLSVLLGLTGGLQNPFALLLIAPAIVAAATLPMDSMLLVSVLTLATAALLGRFSLPLPWFPGEPLTLPMLYRAGVWASILCGLVFMGLYARRLAREARQMSDALTATELVLAREQRLHALDGLAAAAAHELGTPLGTITLVARELERSLPKDSPLAEDIALLRSQALRCREILGRLSYRKTERDPLHAALPVRHLIEEAVEPYRVFDKMIHIDAAPAAGVTGDAAIEPVAERRPGVVHGLSNLVENAVDFARTEVTIGAEWAEDRVTITITDDGPGIPPNLIGSIGEPFVTTRGRADPELLSELDDPSTSFAPEQLDRATGGGLGLGFFIARTLLERSGAELNIANRPAPMTGARVTVTWPRARFALAPDEPELGETFAKTS
jgi:two-component system, sensor histidine kinase RegB